mmetsp:Transcript_12493/g.40141  ORF Transcript_12493/g.40141 Transcript_12493/m.40141 type:complete len:240 (-) Transcript_12493:365-1084(-)
MTRRFFFGSGALSGDLALEPPPEKNVPMFGAGPFFFDALDDAFFFGAPDLDPPPKRPLGSAPPWALACSSLATLAAWARAAFSPVGSAQSFAGPTFRPSRRTAACAELRKASPAAPSSAMSRAPSARSQSHKAPSAAAFAGATAYVDRKETASSSPAAPAASPDAQTATTRTSASAATRRGACSLSGAAPDECARTSPSARADSHDGMEDNPPSFLPALVDLGLGPRWPRAPLDPSPQV